MCGLELYFVLVFTILHRFDSFVAARRQTRARHRIGHKRFVCDSACVDIASHTRTRAIGECALSDIGCRSPVTSGDVTLTAAVRYRSLNSNYNIARNIYLFLGCFFFCCPLDRLSETFADHRISISSHSDGVRYVDDVVWVIAPTCPPVLHIAFHSVR